LEKLAVRVIISVGSGQVGLKMARRAGMTRCVTQIVVALCLGVVVAAWSAPAFAQHGAGVGVSFGGFDLGGEHYDGKKAMAVDVLYSYRVDSMRKLNFTANLLWNFFFLDDNEFMGPSAAYWDDTSDPAVSINQLAVFNLRAGYAIIPTWLRVHAGAGVGWGSFDKSNREDYGTEPLGVWYANWNVAVEFLPFVPETVGRPVIKYVHLYNLEGDSALDGDLWLFTMYFGG